MLDDLTTVIRQPERRGEARGVLRALNPWLLGTLLSLREDALDPLEKKLNFLARSLGPEITGDAGDDPRYLRGRLDTLLELLGTALDHTLSQDVLQAARRQHVKDILRYLVDHGDTRPKALAEHFELAPTHISNILRFMEAYDLIRRTESGRSTYVSLGLNGEAALRALDAEEGHRERKEWVSVLTPKGDRRELPAGSTPLDFAYRIHTNVGHRCIDSKVNGCRVSLDYTLQDGDVVEIITAKGPRGPRQDWLYPSRGFIKTDHARQKIRQWFKHHGQLEALLPACAYPSPIPKTA